MEENPLVKAFVMIHCFPHFFPSISNCTGAIQEIPLRAPAGGARSGAAGLPGSAGWRTGLFVAWLLEVPLARLSANGRDGWNAAHKEPGLKMDRELQAISVTSTCVQANCVHNSARLVVLTKLLASK